MFLYASQTVLAVQRETPIKTAKVISNYELECKD